MPFPAPIKEEALVACARHCCICHRFCGLKVELHHIVHQSEGGPDTFDNCIPLCFDCHGDMRSYDHKHPKGTKYTTAELKAHRDRWYEKVRASGAVGSPTENQNLDRATVVRLLNLLPWNGSIEFVRHNNFAGFSFRLDELKDLFRFRSECEDPAFEFIDADLEALRAALLDAVVRFDRLIALQTFPTHHSGENTVPPEWEIDQPEHFFQVVDDIHATTTDICESYDQLVKMARRKVGVPTGTG
jgi:hypothetical protein